MQINNITKLSAQITITKVTKINCSFDHFCFDFIPYLGISKRVQKWNWLFCLFLNVHGTPLDIKRKLKALQGTFLNLCDKCTAMFHDQGNMDAAVTYDHIECLVFVRIHVTSLAENNGKT